MHYTIHISEQQYAKKDFDNQTAVRTSDVL
jgi:hypothetical protein